MLVLESDHACTSINIESTINIESNIGPYNYRNWEDSYVSGQVLKLCFFRL